MNKFLMTGTAIFFSVLIAAGCGMDNNARENDNIMNNELKNVTYDEQTNENRDNRMNVADDAAKKVADLEEIKYANVIVLDNTAYAAVMLEGNPKGKLSDELKNKVADQVRSTDRNLDNVFVSENPDFFDRVKDYGDKIRNGEPVSGLADEFGEMVKRMFPQSK
ncbi:YhcN/YlaJ family sporulation lipoprotein [Metabacillus sp. JX24]|uniref:YhcN/YlaJ family sporulation lipoprotein n=1 Tax=Metabacillus sp. JX24 TaxID=3240759 RepID=UPI003510547C